MVHTRTLRLVDQLVRFTSCSDALRNLRAAASRSAGLPVGAGGPSAAAGASSPGAPSRASGPGAAGASGPGAAGASGANSPGGAARSALGSNLPGLSPYSSTNTATPGVDEPDLVKTDGKRIVTVMGGVLRVVDARTMRITGVLDLSAFAGLSAGAPANLLLAGDHALILFDQALPMVGGPVRASGSGSAGGGSGSGSAVQASGTGSVPGAIIGPRLVLVDLSGATPRILSEYAMDGALVDARQVGSVARVVIHSAPRMLFPVGFGPSTSARTAHDRTVITHAPLADWLPRYQLTAGQVQQSGAVDCAAVSHPAAATYSGTSMLTVLTFNLSSSTLGDGQPVTVVADGQTIYSDGASLYIASNWQWGGGAPLGSPNPLPSEQHVALYKFDITGPGRPVYEASGTVPGWLLGSAQTAQYALSSWGGDLRVATTTGLFRMDGPPPQSAVYVLKQVGNQLVIAGEVGGLGHGDQIYAVRFAGPVGYVVTYRQVDPLYTLDLSNPAHPRVVGQVQLSGYSAYLYPIDQTHVIGIGQATDAGGHIQGTQVSLFDVHNLAAPVRMAVYRLPSGSSEAEVDPHAFLYWPPARILVVPVQLPAAAVGIPAPIARRSLLMGIASAALVLHIGDHSITKLGLIFHPPTGFRPRSSNSPGTRLLLPALFVGQIIRSLVIGNELWTLSYVGLKANDLTTLAQLGWLPFA